MLHNRIDGLSWRGPLRVNKHISGLPNKTAAQTKRDREIIVSENSDACLQDARDIDSETVLFDSARKARRTAAMIDVYNLVLRFHTLASDILNDTRFISHIHIVASVRRRLLHPTIIVAGLNAGISTGCDLFLQYLSRWTNRRKHRFVRLFFSLAGSARLHSLSHLPESRTRTRTQKRKVDAVRAFSVSLSTSPFEAASETMTITVRFFFRFYSLVSPICVCVCLPPSIIYDERAHTHTNA